MSVCSLCLYVSYSLLLGIRLSVCFCLCACPVCLLVCPPVVFFPFLLNTLNTNIRNILSPLIPTLLSWLLHLYTPYTRLYTALRSCTTTTSLHPPPRIRNALRVLKVFFVFFLFFLVFLFLLLSFFFLLSSFYFLLFTLFFSSSIRFYHFCFSSPSPSQSWTSHFAFSTTPQHSGSGIRDPRPHPPKMSTEFL